MDEADKLVKLADNASGSGSTSTEIPRRVSRGADSLEADLKELHRLVSRISLASARTVKAGEPDRRRMKGRRDEEEDQSDGDSDDGGGWLERV